MTVATGTRTEIACEFYLTATAASGVLANSSATAVFTGGYQAQKPSRIKRLQSCLWNARIPGLWEKADTIKLHPEKLDPTRRPPSLHT
jgi:hypothetical protein